MKLNVLIVDDELLVRNNLINLIDWEENGFNICGEAANGQAAIELIRDLKPHIVILDMNMPIIDGAALSEYICKNHKSIKMIILSSYDNYEYVRSTLKNGALDYVLKHNLDSSELLNVLTKAKDEVMKDTKQQEEKEHDQKRWNILSNMARQNYIKDLVLGINEHSEGRQDYIDIFEMQIETKNIVVVAMNISNYIFFTGNHTDKEKNLLIQSIINLCSQVLQDTKKQAITHVEQGKFALLFSFEHCRSEANINQQLNTYMNKISDSLNRYLNLQTVWGASSPCIKYMDINKCYQIASQIANGYLGSKKLYENGKNMNNKNELIITLSIRQEKSLLAAIEILDINSINSTLSEVFTTLKGSNCNYTSQQMIVGELISIVIKAASKYEIDLQSIYEDKIKCIQGEQLTGNQNLDQMMEKIKDLYIRLIEMLKENNSTGDYSEYVRNAIAYVKNNYSKDISLDETAKVVGITPCYLSHLFKEETEKSFVNFINEIKVEKAIGLIKNGDYKINDLYNKVGFNSYNYFFKVFKEIIGCSPLTYIKKIKNE